ncbi:MAG: glycosyltransferase [Nibricoccus sp.]
MEFPAEWCGPAEETLPMRPVLVNGLGCYEAGSRLVLRELLKSAPAGVLLWVIVPDKNREDMAGSPAAIRGIPLNHRVFGRWLRPLFELGLYLLGAAGFFSRIVNVSNYGWCAPVRTPTVLYYHNALLVEDGHDQFSGRGGRPNWFKRWCLDSCLKRAEKIIVQTDHMAARMAAYAGRRGLPSRVIDVVRPLPDYASSERRAEKCFEFQFFYPASSFPHKRVNLAVQAAVIANSEDSRIGLVVTGESSSNASCVRTLGTISHESVMAHFASSDALLFTSSQETLALPLLEAMHHGLPAVLPALPYAQDIYADSAIYFTNDDVSAVASAMLACAREYEKRREMILMRREQEWGRRTSWRNHWSKLGIA